MQIGIMRRPRRLLLPCEEGLSGWTRSGLVDKKCDVRKLQGRLSASANDEAV